ncbi:MAG: flagellar hook-associated protein FlgL [Ketobacteraceae bacterium]|nr:flagellar hook-associated protein FlgL [Ketobacteraceae bacterium]
MRISTNQSYSSALNSMLDQQAKLSRTQLKISEGKRILKPSDDPIGSGIALNLKQQIASAKQFNKNGQVAETSLQVTESSLASVTDILNRVRELVLQGANGTLGFSDRDSLATEIERRYDELLGLANSQLSDGKYIFSGFRSGVKPFTKDIAGNVNYNGDQGKHFVDVNSSVTVQTNLSGSEVFEEISTGNGTFQATASTANTGTGVISSGSLVDAAAYIPDTYTVTFQNNGASQLTYQVTDGSGAQIVPAPPLTVPADAPLYVEGADIEFNGIQFSISGRPVPGDEFTIEPSASQDIFTTVEDVIEALRSSNATEELQAAMRNRLNNGLVNLDRAMEHVDENRSLIGARLNVVESEANINSNIVVQARSSLSIVEDLDYAEAITDLNRQRVALQAAQQSFVRIEGLSLFNFIS